MAEPRLTKLEYLQGLLNYMLKQGYDLASHGPEVSADCTDAEFSAATMAKELEEVRTYHIEGQLGNQMAATKALKALETCVESPNSAFDWNAAGLDI